MKEPVAREVSKATMSIGGISQNNMQRNLETVARRLVKEGYVLIRAPRDESGGKPRVFPESLAKKDVFVVRNLAIP